MTSKATTATVPKVSIKINKVLKDEHVDNTLNTDNIVLLI